MIKTNKEKLVMQSVSGKVHHPTMRSETKICADGTVTAVPGVGGICYNVKIGDSVFGLAGDHIEPGVSLHNSETTENAAFNFMSCIGNEARVTSGEAKGATGFVTGTHGGIEHVMVHFDDETLEKLAPGDSVLVKGFGQGLAIEGFPDVKVMNVDPKVLEKMGVEICNGKLKVKAAAKVPAHLMGSGIGSANAYRGDYDITTQDKGELEKHKLLDLKFGDVVFLEDCDTTYGRCFRKGAVTVGVIIHGDCVLSGHGPGVTTVLTCQTDRIEYVYDKAANIKNYI